MRYPEIDPGFFVRNRQKLVSLLPNNAAVLVVSNEEDDTRALMGEVMMAYLYLTKKVDVTEKGEARA